MHIREFAKLIIITIMEKRPQGALNRRRRRFSSSVHVGAMYRIFMQLYLYFEGLSCKVVKVLNRALTHNQNLGRLQYNNQYTLSVLETYSDEHFYSFVLEFANRLLYYYTSTRGFCLLIISSNTGRYYLFMRNFIKNLKKFVLMGF